jgi:thymidylate synthase
MSQEAGYLSLLSRILDQGEERIGRNGMTLGMFGERIEFDLSKGFPLMTTKRVFWRGIVEELLWFLRGSTDVKELADKGVHIWNGNSTREYLDSVGLKDLPDGSIGPGYGFQWRCFGGAYPKLEGGVDQIRYIIQELSTNPASRRAVLSAWNPKQLNDMALPPCHITYVFHVSSKHGLSCMMQMRSCDVCAGLPFNIASTALLTSLLAHVLCVPAHRIVVVTGDTHVYGEHIETAKEQVGRTPYPLPDLVIKKEQPAASVSVNEKVKWLESLKCDDFEIVGYNSHPPLKYTMVV